MTVSTMIDHILSTIISVGTLMLLIERRVGICHQRLMMLWHSRGILVRYLFILLLSVTSSPPAPYADTATKTDDQPNANAYESAN